MTNPAARSKRIVHATGFTQDPATYYDVLEPIGGSKKPPMVLIHGGSHTGSCYLATADGHPGWAYAFVNHGYKVVVPDWAGVGRSGYVPYDKLTGELVISGLGKVISALDRPAIVMTHSMSGPYGWKLLEKCGERIAMVVAVAPGRPGNIEATTEFIQDTADFVELRIVPGAPVIKLSHTLPFVAPRGWAEQKLVGASSRFPKDKISRYVASLVSVPPKLLLERVNYANGSPKVTDFSNYAGKRVAVISGTADFDHTVAIDKPIADWLNRSGAKADYIYLGDKGIKGNGHMMMLECNSDELADMIVSWIEKA